MTYSAKSVANAFISLAEREGKPLTNMQVQKLVYIAQGFSLGIADRPLFYDNVHAWQWGPVIPTLYKALQRYGRGTVTEFIPCDETIPEDGDDFSLLKAVWDSYKGFSGAQLSSLTHKPETPWSETWEFDRFGIIAVETIKSHYKRLVES